MFRDFCKTYSLKVGHSTPSVETLLQTFVIVEMSLGPPDTGLDPQEADNFEEVCLLLY